MAKRYEFKPDKSGTGILNKLYLTPQQRRTILKWVLCGVVLLVLSVVQDVILSRVHLYGATTDLVPCGIFLICILEGAESGCIFSLIASALYLFSGTAPGPYCIVYITVLAVVLSMFRQGYLRKGFSAAMLCSCVAVMVYELAVFVTGVFLGMTHTGRLAAFCLTGGLSLIAAPVLYPILRGIEKIGGNTWKE